MSARRTTVVLAALSLWALGACSDTTPPETAPPPTSREGADRVVPNDAGGTLKVFDDDECVQLSAGAGMYTDCFTIHYSVGDVASFSAPLADGVTVRIIVAGNSRPLVARWFGADASDSITFPMSEVASNIWVGYQYSTTQPVSGAQLRQLDGTLVHVVR